MNDNGTVDTGDYDIPSIPRRKLTNAIVIYCLQRHRCLLFVFLDGHRLDSHPREKHLLSAFVRDRRKWKCLLFKTETPSFSSETVASRVAGVNGESAMKSVIAVGNAWF